MIFVIILFEFVIFCIQQHNCLRIESTVSLGYTIIMIQLKRHIYIAKSVHKYIYS